MGLVWIDRIEQLFNDFYFAYAGIEIQWFYSQKRTSFYIDRIGCGDIGIPFWLVSSFHWIFCLCNSIFALQTSSIMIYTVQVTVMPLKDLLDPQGKAVLGGLQNLGLDAIQDVRVGKHITLSIEASSADEAKAIAENASKQLLANQVMEFFEIELI